MMRPGWLHPRGLALEFAGTAALALALVLSGIVAERTAQGALATALLINGGATAAALFVLLRVWPQTRLNPMACLIAVLRGRITPEAAATEACAQLAGAVAGVLLAHALANLALVQMATLVRASAGVWGGEVLAAGVFALVLAARPDAITLAPAVFALALLSAGTAFPNPALTLARTLTDSFVAVRLVDAAGLIAIELAAAFIAAGFAADRAAPAPPPPE